MPTVVADVYIVPLGTYGTSLSPFVAACEEVLKKYPDIQFQINPLSTTLEGDLDRICHVIREMHEAPFMQGANRVTTSIRIDDRRDQNQHTMAEMVSSVKEKARL